METIIQIGAALGAVGVIVGAVIKLFNFIKKLADNISNVSATLDGLEKHSNENYMSLLRLTIMSSEMPIGERIVAGHKYLENGGNGDVKKFLKEKFNITDTVDEATHYKE